MEERITIGGTIEDIIYQNDENGYTVCGIDSEAEGQFTAVGYMAYISEGEKVSVTGSWITHPDYGEQFKIEYYEVLLPTEEEAIIRYLSSGAVYGVRAATAKKLVERFGKDTLTVMLTEPLKMAELKGITKEKAKKIGDSFAQLQSMQNIVMFLQQYNISASMAVKVYHALGDHAVEQIRINPYILADQVDGISFKSADAIAFGQGLPKNNPSRIKAGLRYLLKNAAYSSGHTYLPQTTLIEHGAYELQVEEVEVENCIAELMLSKDLYHDRIKNAEVFYLSSFYAAELYTAQRLSSMAENRTEDLMKTEEIECEIQEMEAETGISLAAEQKNAVVSAVQCGCLVLTGGPGTGKTTTINTIIRLLKKAKLKIVLAAPTGRAAKRMSQVTGMEAKTIHRLLGATPGGEETNRFTHDEQNPLPADAVILDEVSMMDIRLMSAFLRGVRPGAKLIMAGDADQLPSVGAGNVLRDMIASNVVPVIRLDKIFRQAEQSLIVVNAHKINKGELPVLCEKNNDFFFLRRITTENIAATITDLCKNRLPKSYNVNPFTDIQVLSPTKKGTAGTISLNKTLQRALNPPDMMKTEHAYGNTVFRAGDKVMQIKNNYDLLYTREDQENGMGIFNGDMGIIESISSQDKMMTILFDDDKRVEYSFTLLDQLELAYAITVHKSQGSEFPMVVMPVCNFPPMLMYRNLFYTAVTRAKDMVVLVGNEKSVEYMTANNQEQQRYTGLNEKLIEAVKMKQEELF